MYCHLDWGPLNLRTGDFPWSVVCNSFYLCIIHVCSPFSWIFFNTVNSQLRTYTSKVGGRRRVARGPTPPGCWGSGRRCAPACFRISWEPLGPEGDLFGPQSVVPTFSSSPFLGISAFWGRRSSGPERLTGLDGRGGGRGWKEIWGEGVKKSPDRWLPTPLPLSTNLEILLWLAWERDLWRYMYGRGSVWPEPSEDSAC